MRSLFKPILNKTARAAYNMRSATEQIGEQIYKNPYVQGYGKMLKGDLPPVGPLGKKSQRVAAIGGPIYAYNLASDMVPGRTAEVESEESEEVIKEPGKEEILTFDENQTDVVDDDIEIQEDVGATSEGGGDTMTEDAALVDQSNMYGGTTDNESIQRIEGYKDVIREIMGSGSETDKLNSIALLVQVGSALMSGKSTDSGVKGFMDVVGQAGMQLAPSLFQMGMEKGKAEREIGAAALNMYMSEMDKMGDRSGPFTVVYENIYKQNPNGTMAYDANGDPIPIDRRRVQTFYRKSPEINHFMGINGELGYDRFTFIDTTASDKGQDTAAGGGFGQGQFQGKAASDAQFGYATYLKKGLDTMSDYIMPLLIEQRDTLTGGMGEIGRQFGPKKALIEALSNGILTGAGGKEDFEKDMAYTQTALTKELANKNFIVYEAPTTTINVGGKQVGIFVDTNNSYGMNEGARYSEDGKTLIDPGIAQQIVTADGLKMLLDNPNRQTMITFENTLGLMLARDRQPTGRMLSDIITRSFRDTKMTGFGDSEATSPVQVLNNYTNIFNQLSQNMDRALRSAGYTDDKEEADKYGLNYAPDNFRIKGLDKFYNAYYGLRADDGRYNQEINGAPLYGAWYQSISAGLNQDSKEDNAQAGDIYNNVMEQLQ